MLNIRNLKEQFALDHRVMARVRQVGDALSPRIEEMVEGLFDWLSQQPDYGRVLLNPDTFLLMKRIQERYWKEFLSGSIDAEYVERRQNVGRVYANIASGIPFCMAVFDWCGEWLVREIAELDWDAHKKLESTATIGRLIRIDTTLVIDAFTDTSEHTIRKQNELLHQTIRAYDRFVPHKLLGLLNTKDITEIELGDQVEQRLTVLFTDIRGFSSLSEKLTPQENFNFLNSFLSQMEPIVSANNGIIDKYIGDAIMAVFPNSANDGLRCSLQMLRGLEKYNEGRKRAGYQTIRIGIGLNSGLSMIGTIGGHSRMDCSVIGNVVNLGSRIESLTETYGLDVLIGESTFRSLNEENQRFTRFVDRVMVKGMSQPQSIYEVFAGDESSVKCAKLETKELFEEALTNFHDNNVGTAQSLLKECHSINEADVPVRLYLQRCENYFANRTDNGSHETRVYA